MGRTTLAAAAATVLLLVLGTLAGTAFAQAPTASDFEKVTLDDDTQNPMELDVADDGRVFYIERDGRLQIWKPDTQQTVTAGTIPVTLSQENGLLGLQLAPDFPTSHWVYLFYSQLPDDSETQVVSRFKVNGDTLDTSSEQRILTFKHQVAQCCHSSGSLYFAPDGSLYISVGDNTNPFDSSGFDPIDERPGREYWDAQRTAGNTNDLNGKILHIMPLEFPTGPPGVGSTYTIPANNLFDEAQDTNDKTRPEIFAMGLRNPFRFTVDPETGWVLMADYGPDASATNPNRGPQGSVEFNVMTRAGNYGWPYCIRDNVPYNDYDFATSTSGPKFDCANLVNNSPNNTGLTNLPPAIGASGWMGYSETDPRLPGLGTGGAPMGGPRYHYDPNLVSDRKFPAFYDDKWFIAEWNNGWIRTADLNASGNMTKVDPFALGTGYRRPMDLDFGPDGALYVIEWGSGFNGNNADSGVYRIDYKSGNQRPVAHAAATPAAGLAPLEVSFSSAGSNDPEGTAITYAWDFDGDGTTDSTEANPSHTFTENGVHNVKLTVTDESGLTGVDNVQVTVGNRPPQVTIEFPGDGQLAAFTDTVPYRISVTDPEDGSTGAGISCDDVHVTIALGHDEHSHGLSQQTGCTGSFQTGLTSGHGAEANTFTVLGVSYTDKGGPGGIAPLTGRAEAILQPKRKQAEFFSSTGRIPGAATGGDAGVQTETTADTQGGGLNIGFIEDGDYVSYEPFDLAGISAMRFRVASAGAGGTIEVRLDAPDGQLVAATDTITPTGAWQSFKDVTLPISAPAGRHELFLVFRNPGSTNSLMNVNWIDFIGKGAATTAAPDVSTTATPSSGTAPLPVHFDATAVDPDAEAGDTLTYAWDFGVPGTNDDTSSLEDPNYTYEQAGTYTATLTVTDGHGGSSTASTTVTVNPAGAACPTGFRDDFNGSDLAAPWEVIRRDQTLVVAGGTLTMPAQAGDIYQGTNTAKNIVVRPAPAGAWTAIAKINLKPLVQYQQAGLIVYGDDDNYTKLDRAATNSATGTNTQKFEFINETAATARNTNQDATANLPVATFPDDYYVRIVSDGTQITGSYSTDGENWTNVGRAANLPANPRIGLEALSNAAATSVDAKFDWFTLEGENVPVTGIGAGDTFTGGSLNTTRWNAIQREDPDHYEVSGGALRITTVAGDIYQTGDASGARNFMLQTADHAGADYVLETKLSSDADGGYQQGGILVYTDDDNYVKLDAISDANQTRLNRIELRSETAAAIGNPQPQFNVPAGTTDIWLRLTKLGTSYSGEYSFDGETFTAMSAAVTHEQVAPRFGLFTIGANQPGKTFAFDYFKVDGDLGCEAEQTNADPVISSATADPSGGIAPLPVSFEAAATDADGDALTYGWDFDDDGTQDATGAGASFTYASAGTKTARLTVSDGKGGTATRAITISVLPADDPSARFRALVFSKTAGFRHSSIPDGIAAIRQLGADENFQVDATEDASMFRDDVLSHYDTVIWLSTTGDALSDAQQAAFERFIRAGGGYTGIHSAADTEYTWAWYGDLVGAYFRNHPNGTPTATVVVEDDDDPSTAGLPARWERTDEWYNYQSKVNPVVNGGGDDYSPRASGVHVLLTMDESTYAEADGSDDVDDDHPIAWCQRFDGGRSWYTGMGHTEASFSEPLFLSHILAGIEITAGATPSADCGVTEEENHDPTVTAERTPAGNVRVGVPIAFTATGEDADGDTLTYAWDFGDGTTATEQNPTKTYTSAGTYTVTVTVSDGNGGTATATLPVTIQPNRNPSAGGLAASPQAGFAPLNVTFTGAASDPDGHEVSYAWDLDGDGTDDSTDQNPSYTYTETGTYTPRVRVTDAFGGSTTRTFVINVIPVERDPAAKYRVLVFSKTAAFRHSSIDEGIAAIKLLGEQNDFQVDAVEEPSLFTDEVLARYDAVIWLSTTGDVLNDAQQAAFERYIEHGGGYVGIHSAADTEYGWAWYGQLVGGYFRNHPNGTPAATVLVEDPTHPSTAHLPRPWPRVDEWYNYQSPVNPSVGGGGDDYSVRNSGVHVLLAMDESTYAEADGSDDIDDDHPISWCHRYDGGRAWYTGLGHTEASYTEPEFLQHILGGIDVAAGAVADPACGVSEAGVPVVEAFADPLTGTAPLQVQFSSTAADPDGQALIYRWDFGDGGSALGSSPLHTYTKPGMYTATVTVRDPDGHTASATVRVTVDAPDNMVPMVYVAADPTEGDAPLPVRFQAQAIDPDGPESKLVYRWSFGDGDELFGRNVRHTYLTPGTYKAKVTVTDAGGASVTSEEITITVTNPPGNQAPSVQALAAPKTGTAPLRVDFSSASSDPDGDQLLSVWDFGDGVKAGGESATHTYTQPGTYNAKVTVTDPGGKSASASVQIVVKAKVTTNGGGSVQPPPADGGDVAGEETSQPLVKLSKRFKVKRVLKRGLRYRVSCETRCRVSSVLKVKGQRLGRSNARRIAAGHSRRIVVRLKGNVRRNLVAAMRDAHVRTLRAKLVMKIRTADGTKTIRKAVTLRR